MQTIPHKASTRQIACITEQDPNSRLILGSLNLLKNLQALQMFKALRPLRRRFLLTL